MKMLKINLIVLLSVLLLFSSALTVSADEVIYPSHEGLMDKFGLTLEEYEALFDENGVAIVEHPQTYTTGSIDEDISLQDGGIMYSYTSDSGGAGQTGFISIGSSVSVTGGARYLGLKLYNDDYVLFSTPGQLTLNCHLYAFTCHVIVKYADGSQISMKYQTDLTADVNAIEINNPNADIVEIWINQQNPISSNNDLVISGGILSYSYESYGASNIFELLARFIGGFFSNLTSAFGDVDNSSDLDISISNLETTESNLLSQSGNIDDVAFEDSFFNNASFLSSVVWVSEIMQLMYSQMRFSSIFNITLTLLMAAILLGFARHWKGGK